MGVKKEIVLIIIVLIGITILEIVTSNISKQSVDKISKELDTIIEQIENAIWLKENNNLAEEEKENMKKNIKEFKDNWVNEQNKLSIFVEHDELEKVTESLIILEENSKNEQYEEALANTAEFRYWLDHFAEKEKLKIKNIF